MRSPVLRALNLASAVTLLGVLCGGAGLVGAATGRKLLMLCAVALAMLTDYLDGKVARRLGQSSDFGAQLDSLSDAQSFVLVPALALNVSMPGTGSVIIGGLYLLCGISRLAAFHSAGIQLVRGRECFYGVPTSTGGAAFLLASALAPWCGAWLVQVVLLAMAPLMISGVAYPKRGAHEILCTAAAVIAILLEVVRTFVQ